jgi:hypothetical protein
MAHGALEGLMFVAMHYIADSMPHEAMNAIRT